MILSQAARVEIIKITAKILKVFVFIRETISFTSSLRLPSNRGNVNNDSPNSCKVLTFRPSQLRKNPLRQELRVSAYQRHPSYHF